MAIGDIIVGIDIGTSKVTTVVGEVNNFNQIETVCMSKCKCIGIKKGKIIDVILLQNPQIIFRLALFTVFVILLKSSPSVLNFYIYYNF